MKKTFSSLLVFSLLFLFFIQMAGILVSSIYTLDLLNTSLDAKVLGVLFFFAPVTFVKVRRQMPGWMTWVFFGFLFVARGLTPYLDTNGRMLVSGLGTAAALSLLLVLLSVRDTSSARWAGLGLALAVAMSTMLRTANSSIDYSLTISGSWSGWGLGLVLGWTLMNREPGQTFVQTRSDKKGVAAPLLGLFLVITLVYFVFSAPAVIARWTEGNYAGIVLCVSLLSIGWIVALLLYPSLLVRLSRRILITWNLLFSTSLLATILAHRVAFPASPEASATVVGAPTLWQQLPMLLMLLLFPVLFIDMQVFWSKIQQAEATPGRIAAGMLLGNFVLVVLVFMNIFSNVWGYVEPVSYFFRNKFWLPFLLIGGLISLLIILQRPDIAISDGEPKLNRSWGIGLVLVVILGITTNGVYISSRTLKPGLPVNSLTVMTYNIQQANDQSGEQSYLRQLALIQQVSPDILAIQEGDSTRISLNNVDYVRYYADKMGYYSYYGPGTITGGYGTAILSRYPLKNTHSVFTFSDQDENGTAVAQFEVDGRVFNIYNIHPDGTDTAKNACIQTVLEFSANQANVIVLGDYNLRDYDEGYQLINRVYTNAWTSVFPSAISKDGVDMSGKNRIDHIFVSKDLLVREPVYLLPPQSGTDHPAHWAVIYWNK
jgi:endonuclease/exonuclease/phosphatase family metal-dependent hydrolase